MVTGLFVGPVIALFSYLISSASSYGSAHRYLVFLLPIGAVFTYCTYQIFGGYQKFTSYAISDINAIEESSDGERMPQGYVRLSPWMGVVNLFNSIISHSLGASVGKEGVGVQLGISSAVFLDSIEGRLRKKGSSLECYLMTGAAAAFGALFQSPVAGTLFGMQFASPKFTRLDKLLPCLLASFSATLVADAIGIHVVTVPVYLPVIPSYANYLRVIVFAIIVGLVTRLCCSLVEIVREKAATIFKGNQMITVLALATLLVIISFLTYVVEGDFKYNGLSTELITFSIFGQTDIVDFILKFSFILISLAAGFQGGEVLPLLVSGSLLGGAIGPLLGLEQASSAILGAIGMLSGGTNLSLVCFALGMELFHYTEPTTLFIVAAASFVMSGKIGIYGGQKL